MEQLLKNPRLLEFVKRTQHYVIGQFLFFASKGPEVTIKAGPMGKSIYQKTQTNRFLKSVQDTNNNHIMAQRIFNTNLTVEERRRIGELVKALRSDSGISQRDLAYKTGLSPTRIVQIEKGTLDYRIDTLIVILNHFDRKISFM
jgi:DNA-binding XRE family transcriptional regulator